MTHPLTYKAAGVDIDAGDEFIRRITPLARETLTPQVLAGIGGFSALYSLAGCSGKRPVLVSATDGVGTKLKIACLTGRHDTIGIDLVAMSANDVVITGATPLFFLDYFATGKLDLPVAEAVLRGIVAGCRQARCALVGGETAEMPDLYAPGEYDLAGFLVGLVEEEEMITGASIIPGDAIIGLQSTGLHSNGYSLARKVLLEKAGLSPDTLLPESGRTLGEEFLTPTRIYVNTVLSLKTQYPLKGIAHITGGGLPGNVPRILPPGCAARLTRRAWTPPPLCERIRRTGNISEEEMYRTFNMGIGLALIVPAAEADALRAEAEALGEHPLIIGEVVAGEKKVVWG